MSTESRAAQAAPTPTWTPTKAPAIPAPSPRPSRYPAAGGRVYNFSAGPATLPLEVLEEARAALIDFAGLGAGVLEVSHRSGEFLALVDETLALLKELMGVPDSHKILLAHGGGQLQFSMVPMNLIACRPARKALYVDTGVFSSRALDIATRYGYVNVPAHSRENEYDRIPEIDPATVDPEASYLHITTNNTVMGTRWVDFPETGDVPLVGDMTSEVLSRTVDVSRFGCLYAGAQKNLAPPGMALVVVREDLLGHALPETPSVMNFADLAADGRSLLNTPPSFTIYVMNRMLHWVRAQGGVSTLEQRNEAKAALLYEVIDADGFYRGFSLPEYRATMNATFDLPTSDLTEAFLAEATAEGLYALRGHSARGAVRASIYNAMPEEGVQALAAFMTEFRRTRG